MGELREGGSMNPATRCGWGLLAVGLVSGGMAWAQLSADDVAALQQRAKDEHWTFTVGENGATKYPLSVLCGSKPPPDWRTGAPFVSIKPKARGKARARANCFRSTPSISVRHWTTPSTASCP